MIGSWRRESSVIPGFTFTLSYTLFYLTCIVLIPLSGLFFTTAMGNFGEIWQSITSPRVMSAYRISFGISFLAALINMVFGFIIAWVLVRYDFFGKKLLDAVVDLPFALPTAIAGIALAALYGENGWIGSLLAPFGIKLAFNPAGIAIALIFVGIPFTIRTVQPVLEGLDIASEEAAACLGASRWQVFWRVIFPAVFPAVITGFLMAFARGIGEYGSVIFIAGNIPLFSEIVPLIIVNELEQYNVIGATALGLVMLLTSFALLFLINLLQKWSRH
jgi:sulfate transport system permease protein